MSTVVPMEPADAASRSWTVEQRHAIEAREEDLLLAAAAGSGKTSVLVERFVRSVIEDGIGVGEILTITFTEKAAAEMRERIRARLRELGEDAAASAAEGAYIATIHGFCARVLRAHALSAGLDPAFAVLDDQESRRLAEAAFEAALEKLTADVGSEAIDLVATYTAPALRAAIRGTYAELRSRGELHPALPPLDAAPPLEPAREAFLEAAAAAAAELATVDKPGVRVAQALERLTRCEEVAAGPDPWPGDLDALCLPKGNGAALSTPVCQAYAEALGRLRDVCAHHRAQRTHRLLDALLRAYGRTYERHKRERSGVDFEDLELLTRELLLHDRDLRGRLRNRFRRLMVDEFQDTNSVQLDLVDAMTSGNLFTVGDAQQSIYGFRHADVELFERLAAERRAAGRYATLRVNFRSRPEILDVLNLAFEEALGHRFAPLVAGREDAPADDPRVEVLLVDKGADWLVEGLAAPWRLAEARQLAARIDALITSGTPARDIVVLTRATTDLRTYERALEDRGVPTYLIGGRGYWGHPQVLDLVAYLRALANPRDEEALLTVLASPLVGVSLDALVLIAGTARTAGTDPWSVLREEALAIDELGDDDRARLARFVPWLTSQRTLAGRRSLEELIDRALADTGYDLAVLGLAGGRRRLANVRKLMRLAREHEVERGPDLRAFLDLVAERASGSGADARESEAPVEGEALDAVRLMTIHRSKGLEFPVVCVADLGRVRRVPYPLMRIGEDGRIGLRLGEPGTGKREPALAYKALGEEELAREDAEERRLFYVAMTRAQERLVLSGAAKLEGWPDGNGGTPVCWIAPAVIPDFAARIEGGAGVSEAGVAYTLVREEADGPGEEESERPVLAGTPGVPPVPPGGPGSPPASLGEPGSTPVAPVAPPPPSVAGPATAAPAPPPAAGLSTLSYSSLVEYRRCGYRFYTERVLGLPRRDRAQGVMGAGSGRVGSTAPAFTAGTLSAADRGVLIHALLEPLDFRRPLVPTPEAIALACRTLRLKTPSDDEAAEVVRLVGGFADSDLCGRLGEATQVRREQRFSFPLNPELLINGALDVVARERANVLVVDYKSDRLPTGTTPADVVAREYAEQRLIYALAVLLDGAPRVEIAHVFLERPEAPVLAAFTSEDAAGLKAELGCLTGGVVSGVFTVTPQPHRAVCDGCPAEGGLCSWPVAMTRRERPDQLF